MTIEYALAWAASPVQWAVLGLVLVLVFAPRLLPVLARLAGWSLQAWVGRQAARAGRVVVLPARHAREPGEGEDLAELPAEDQFAAAGASAQSRPEGMWRALAVVSMMLGLVIGILWLLLRSR